jgi:lysyl-tRNA synthetase class 2
MFFREQGFWEVETPLLSVDTVVDRYIEPIRVEGPLQVSLPGNDGYWLQTSPEFAMKRLLAAGADAIFQITRAFRRDELGPWHNPEFTMVEWYRVGDNLQSGIERLSLLSERLLARGPALRKSYRQLFSDHFGLNPHRASAHELAQSARQAAIVVPHSMMRGGLPIDDRDAWLNLLWAEIIQPQLGHDQPTIVFDYPASQAALARIRDESEPVAERFELFASGVELANGYHELLDAVELRERQTTANQHRHNDGRRRLPQSNRLLDAMQHGLPPCAGVALGFDRLVMVALGMTQLRDVIAFPFDRA